jgi:glycine dehydrogenase subunit 1
VDPRYVETLRTYGRGTGYEPETFEAVDGRGGAPEVDDDVACVIVQHPNAYGLLEPARELFGRAHAGGAHAIQVFDPLSLGVLAPPGELRADIAVAEGQPLGNHLNLGGPYLGVIATRLDDVRRLPGRIVGETLDVDGRLGYVLTLQAREQHIRREKATSNICTNQTLMAIAATIYLAWLGPRGLRELGRHCAAKASYAAERVTEVPGVELLFPGAPFFKEFALRLPGPATEIVEALLERGYLAGVPLPDANGTGLLVAVTERRTRKEIDGLALALKEALA